MSRSRKFGTVRRPRQAQKVIQSKTPDPLGSNFDDGILLLANFGLLESKFFDLKFLKIVVNFLFDPIPSSQDQ